MRAALGLKRMRPNSRSTFKSKSSSRSGRSAVRTHTTPFKNIAWALRGTGALKTQGETR